MQSVGAFVVGGPAAGGVRAGRAAGRRAGAAAVGVLPPAAARQRRSSASGSASILIGLTSYVPTYLEALLGVSPLDSGLTLAALTIGWPIAASQSGRLYLRFGFRTTALIGSVGRRPRHRRPGRASTRPVAARRGAACFVIGAGLGLVASPSLIAAQSSVGWSERGRRHRRQPVRPVDGQRRRGRGARGGGQRPHARRHPGAGPGAVRRRGHGGVRRGAVVALATVVAAAAMPRGTGGSPGTPHDDVAD